MSAPAGWFPDPEGQDRLRYWDGSAWTENYAAKPAGGAADPASGATGGDPGGVAAQAQTAPTSLAPTAAAPVAPAVAAGVGYAQPGQAPAAPGVPAGGYAQPSAPGGYGQASAPGQAGGAPPVPGVPSGGYGQASAPYGGGYGQTPGYGGYGQPPKKNNTPLIVAIAVVAVLVLGVAGFFGFRALNPSDPGPTAGPSAPPSDPPPSDPPPSDVAGPSDPPSNPEMPEMVETLTLGVETTGQFGPEDGWGARLSITTPGVYFLHGIAAGAEDLQLTLFDSELNAISFMDDRPPGADALEANNLNPLLPVYLEAGEYAVVITEYANAAASFSVLVEDLTAVPELPQDADVSFSINAGNVWVNYVAVGASGNMTVDARNTNGADLFLTVFSPTGDYLYNDDREADTAANVGGESFDPLLVQSVDPGVYIVMVSEFFGSEAEAVVAVTVE